MMLQCKQCQDFRTLNSCQLCCRVCPASYKSPHYSHSLLQHSHNHTQYVLHNWCDGAFNLLVVLICILSYFAKVLKEYGVGLFKV